MAFHHFNWTKLFLRVPMGDPFCSWGLCFLLLLYVAEDGSGGLLPPASTSSIWNSSISLGSIFAFFFEGHCNSFCWLKMLSCGCYVWTVLEIIISVNFHFLLVMRRVASLFQLISTILLFLLCFITLRKIIIWNLIQFYNTLLSHLTNSNNKWLLLEVHFNFGVLCLLNPKKRKGTVPQGRKSL